MNITTARAKHISLLLPLFRSWYEQERSYDRNIRENRNQPKRILTDHCTKKTGVCFFATDKEPIGILCGRLGRGSESSSVRVQAQITAVFVDKDHRRQGVARKLFERFMEWATEHDAEQLLVNVAAKNDKARSAYEAFAFEPNFIQYRKKI